MKVEISITICVALFNLVLGADPRDLGISIVGTLDTNNRRPGVLGGGVVGPNRGYPGGNHNGNQGNYPGGNHNGNQGNYPGGNHNGNQGNYPNGDRYPDSDRYPSGDRYPNGDRDRYPENSQYQPEYDYVTFYEQPYFRGWSFKAPLSNKCRNLENDYNNYNNGISSIKTHGNCVIVFTRYDCRGREFTIRPRYDERPGHGSGRPNGGGSNYRPNGGGSNNRPNGGGSNYRPNYLGHSELAEDLNNSISSYRRC